MSSFIVSRLVEAIANHRLSDVVDAVSDYNITCLPRSFVFVTTDMKICFVLINLIEDFHDTYDGRGISISAACAADLILLHDPLTNKQVVLKNREFVK